jgi:ABC-type polysaccharide/polyol phosphate export permease
MASAAREFLRSATMWRVWLRLGLLDVRLRFRRSLIGPSWIFLSLAVTIAAIGYVYSHLLGQDVKTFIPFLTAGLVVWGYLTASITEGAYAFVACEGYIKQIALPVYVYVFRFFASVTISALISFAAFFAVALLFGVPMGPGTLWAVPGFFLLSTASLLLILILAHVNARFRDAGTLAGVAMQIGFYVTPVLFPPELLLEHGRKAVVLLNPLYHLLEVVRRPLLRAEPADAVNYLGAGIVLVALLATSLLLMQIYGRRIVFSL